MEASGSQVFNVGSFILAERYTAYGNGGPEITDGDYCPQGNR